MASANCPANPRQEPQPSRYDGEEVLALYRTDLAGAGLLVQGFNARGWDRCLALVARRGRFVPRERAEEDPSLKQIIPYAVVVFEHRVFLFRRTSRGGEVRLHGKFSIGVGGHINAEGVPPARLVEAGLLRELEEELVFDRPFTIQPIGLINDDSVPVGQVHLGIVYQVSAADEGVRVRERDLLEGQFTPVASLRPLLDSMETWSRLVAEALFFKGPGEGEVPAARPAGQPY